MPRSKQPETAAAKMGLPKLTLAQALELNLSQETLRNLGFVPPKKNKNKTR